MDQSCSNESREVPSRRTGAHDLGFKYCIIEQPTRYSIKTNSIKKSSLFKNDKANIKVGRAFLSPFSNS